MLDSTNVKSIFTSVTFWGSAIAAIALAFPALSAKFGITTANTAVAAQYITQFFGFVIAVYGRFNATKVVTLTGRAPKPLEEAKP